MNKQNNNRPHNWTVYIDGASRNNPGKSGAGVFMKKDGEVVCREGFYLGIKTNNQAEYLALLLGLFFIDRYVDIKDEIRIVSDSELLVKQIRGLYKVKNEGLKPLHALAQSLIPKHTIQVLHVLRTDNKEADKLANKGIDTKKTVPQSFVAMLGEHNITL